MYTDRKAQFYGERHFPILKSDLVEASYLIDTNDLEPFATAIGQQYDIRGIVPFREDKIESSARLCELLDLSWNDPTTLRRFRDKYAMRAHVERVAPTVRVPAARTITSSRQLGDAPLPERFVVKPNDGMGNMKIGIFDQHEVERAIAHIDAHPKVEWIVEEFIGGTEYHVNGQVRPDGRVEVTAVYEYVRGVVNGYPTVYLAEIQCHTDEPPFEELASYATELLTALGLRACPFHLEAKVDERGPCLVDLGARFPSEGTARSMTRMHPERPGMFLVAAHDYLGRDELLDIPLGWDHYDSTRAMFVFGIAEQACQISSLHGIDEIEAMPEFVRWPVKPSIGQEVEQTTRLLSAPWVVEVESDMTRDDALKMADEIRDTISWNLDDGQVRRGEARLREVLARSERKGRWLAHRAATEGRDLVGRARPGA